ncbi:hypothetical protein A1Q2_00586 [Trichosporon asahii var. asahii CBS 8904]|uniref:Uncharacterized protein n=1 Tax=Trichosporon asahii var. asahii (strain CBS 8904) TaxID=1220162 RepID=K1VLU1_TRIAC|nr:hypothetical protein A1Q2_00586 [Trichosporon asahii var. asahii CBS 8904]
MPTIDLSFYPHDTSASAMPSIDLDYYPHITDALFAFAPSASLKVMRGVCRSWRSRADAALSGHISFRATYTCYDEKGVRELSLRLSSVRDPSVGTIFTLGLKTKKFSSRSTGLLPSAIRVVDIDAASHKHFALTHSMFPIPFFERNSQTTSLRAEYEVFKNHIFRHLYEADPIAAETDEAEMGQRNDRTVRYAVLDAETFCYPLDVGCIVLFAQNTTPETKATAYLEQIGRLRLCGPGKAVLHLRHPGSVDGSVRAEMDDITIFVHPWAHLKVSYDSVAEAVPNVLGTLLDIVQGVQSYAKRINVVGLERLSPASLGLEEFDEDLGDAVVGALEQLSKPVAPAYQHIPPGFSSQPCADPLAAILPELSGCKRRCTINFYSVQAYRCMVGREQFEIDTNEGALW